MLQRVALLGGARGKIVVPAGGGVDLLDQADQHPLIFPPHTLQRNQVEAGKEADEHVVHAAVGQLGIVEPAKLVGGDADRGTKRPCRQIARRSSAGSRRAGLGNDLPTGFAVLLLRLNLVVQEEIDSTNHRGNHEHDEQLLRHGH